MTGSQQPPLHPDFHFFHGVRALSSIAVVVYHTHRVLGALLPSSSAMVQLLRESFFFRLASVGNFGVDLFMFMCALFEVHELLPQLEGTADKDRPPQSLRQVVRQYYRRRALRILPAYLLANLVILLVVAAAKAQAGGLTLEAAAAKNLVFGPCLHNLWANAFFATHWMGRQACGLQLWSMGVETHFYVVFPLMLLALGPRGPGFRRALAIFLVAAVVGGTLWQLRQAHTLEFQLPFSDDPRDGATLNDVREALWWTFGGRIPVLAAGALIGLVIHSPRALAWLQCRKALVSLAAVALEAIVLRLALFNGPIVRLHGDPAWSVAASRLYAGLLWCGSPLYGAALAAATLALLLKSDPLHAAAASLLAAKPLQLLATLSFSLYLLHEQARFFAVLYLVPTGLLPAWAAVAPLQAFAGLSVITLTVAYGFAYVSYNWVEKRFH